jgi:hypothetical protein
MLLILPRRSVRSYISVGALPEGRLPGGFQLPLAALSVAGLTRIDPVSQHVTRLLRKLTSLSQRGRIQRPEAHTVGLAVDHEPE